MSTKPIIVVGHAGLDFVYRIEAFPPRPTKIRALEHIVSGGGMAANAAAAAARLGAPVSLWSRIGSDEAGELILRSLVSSGVETQYVRRYEGRRSPTATVLVDRAGERLVVGEDDHEMPMGADWLPLRKVADAAVVISDLNWLEGTLALFAEARRHGVTTLLDVDLGSGGLLGEVIGLTDVAILSAPAFEKHVPGRDDALRLEHLIRLGVRHAGVTRGAQGYGWATAAGETGWQAAFRVETVDTTGAGDAFHGAFAWGLAQGLSDAECARSASAVAAMSCTALGARAGLPTATDLKRFLAERSREPGAS